MNSEQQKLNDHSEATANDKQIDHYGYGGHEPEWMKKINFDEYEKLAAIGYIPTQIAKYYKINPREFMWYYNLIGSPLAYHYERGQLVQQAAEGIAMADAASSGDNPTQASRFDKLRHRIQFKNNINKVFFDETDI